MSYRYFSDSEMVCPCGCGKLEMDEDFMYRLIALRGAWGRPIIINSGYRCSSHDYKIRKIRGQAGTGFHSRGLAADPRIYYDVWDFVSLAFRFGFSGIGVRAHGPTEVRFIHLHLGDERLTRPAFWTCA